MSVTEFLSIAGIVLSVLAPLLGFIAYVWKNLIDKRFDKIEARAKEDAIRCEADMENLERQYNDLRLNVAENYVRHIHLEEIKKTLQRIFDKLDGKEDRAPRRRTGE